MLTSSRRAEPRVEYEVVWDGRNDGQGGDLLSNGLQRHAQVEAPTRLGIGEAQRIVRDALQAYGALGYRQLIALTDLNSQTVNSTLHTMLTKGVVEPVDGFGRVVEIGDRSSYGNRRYRLKLLPRDALGGGF